MNTSPKIMLLVTLTTILISAGTLGSLAQAAPPTTSTIPYASASWRFDTAGDVATPDVAGSPVRVRLAISSSVPAHASAEGGAIAPDDLLVAASQSGYVMRAPADASANAIIGKARGRLVSGTGVINIQETVR